MEKRLFKRKAELEKVIRTSKKRIDMYCEALEEVSLKIQHALNLKNPYTRHRDLELYRATRAILYIKAGHERGKALNANLEIMRLRHFGK